jgi:hypothetical protein
MHLYTLSRVRGSVTNNNGFRIGWFDLLAFLLQLESMIPVHNQWLCKTRSITYWTTSVFSFYCDEWRTNNYCSLSRMNWTNSFMALGRTEYTSRSPCLTVPLLFCYSVAAEAYFSEPLAGNGLPRLFVAARTHVWRNGLPLWLHYSGFQASYHNIYVYFMTLAVSGFCKICCLDDRWSGRKLSVPNVDTIATVAWLRFEPSTSRMQV